MDIKFSWPSSAQWASLGRHAVSYSAGAATAIAGVAAYAGALHILQPDQAGGLVSGFQQVADGVKAVVGGVTTLAGGLATLTTTGMGIWAAYTASQKNRAQAVAAIPGTTVVTTPELAAATPQTNIVSNTAVTLVPKG